MAQELAPINITPETCFVPGTHKGKGRRTAVAPGDTAARYLHYGRITLDGGDAPISFQNNDHETGLVCLNGAARVSTAGQAFELSRYDALYIPRDSEIQVQAKGAEGCDLAEMSAPVAKRYPIQFVAYADVRQNPKLHLIAGKPPAERDLNILIGGNVDAGRIMAGVTFSTPGNWTSWPPHEHSRMLEEAYLFIDMPAPAFGVQFVYTNPEKPVLTPEMSYTPPEIARVSDAPGEHPVGLVIHFRVEPSSSANVNESPFPLPSSNDPLAMSKLSEFVSIP